MNGPDQPEVVEIDTSHRKHAVITGVLFLVLCILLYFVFAVFKPDVSLKGTLNKKSTEAMGEGTGSPKVSPPDVPGGGKPVEKTEEVAEEVAKPVDLQSSTNPPPSLFVSIDLSEEAVQGKGKGKGIGKGKGSPSKTKKFGNRGLKGRGRAMGNGATPAVFDAIDLGLEWLARNQESDGRWDSAKWRGGGHDLGVTGLALLAFLGNGNSHADGKYRENVLRGLNWIARHQKKSGHLGWKTFYEQGIATMALCEDVAMTYDNRYRNVAGRAVEHILANMGPNGGYGYQGPGNDTSVFGWQIMAIKSAVVANLFPTFPQAAQARKYLDLSINGDGSTGYRGRGSPKISMTAIGLFCRIFVGYKKNHPEVIKAAKLVSNAGPNVKKQYYTYYSTYCMFQIGGLEWKKWNDNFRDPLIALQIKSGANKGSWDKWGHGGGRVYSTALNIMSLEVYQRYLPSYW